METQLTKNQHFVPQFLLRNFSAEENGQYRCNVYDVRRNQLRYRQNIKDVFSRNFMYDKDNAIEHLLAKNVEGLVVDEIKSILRNPSGITAPPSINLLRFLTAQLGRTQQAYEQLLSLVNAQMRTIVTELSRLNDLDKEFPKKLSIKPSDPSVIRGYMALDSSLDWPLASDLKHHVVINRTGTEFAISDHPIFKYNWYLRDSDELMVSSIGAAGVQLFFPLSPTICYCLYDPAIYKYGCEKKTFTEILKQEDVEILNSFQILNAETGIAFRQSNMGALVSQYARKWGRYSTYTSEAEYKQSVEGQGKMRITHVTWLKQTRVPCMPSFVKIKKKARRHPIVGQYRNPAVMGAVHAYKSRKITQK